MIHTDAIGERLEKALGGRSSASVVGQQLFVVRVLRDEFEISADSSGELLHMRGYRLAVGKAPIRETLAAALLIAADWEGDTPLIDPFCGSGTIPIEGALMARRIAPGINRTFTALHWPGVEAREWKDLLDEARAGELARSSVPIIGSDRDAGAITAASANAERAGVAGDIDFSVRAVSAIAPPSTAGLVATNPPYGVRASPKSSVRNLYAQFGNVLRAKCEGWRVALFSADPKLTGELRLTLSPAFRTTNGGLKVSAVTASLP